MKRGFGARKSPYRGGRANFGENGDSKKGDLTSPFCGYAKI